MTKYEDNDPLSLVHPTVAINVAIRHVIHVESQKATYSLPSCPQDKALECRVIHATFAMRIHPRGVDSLKSNAPSIVIRTEILYNRRSHGTRHHPQVAHGAAIISSQGRRMRPHLII